MDKNKIEEGIKLMLEGIGEDTSREGLVETPARVARAAEELFGGLELNPSIHTEKVFHQDDSELVLVKDIEFHSMCEHHLLPFYGKAAIAYVPNNGEVIGLSKVARILDDVAKKPQMQERITEEVASVIMDSLNPQGVMVILQGEHMCMSLRGVEKHGSSTVTKETRGVFKENEQLRREVFQMISFD